TISRPNAPPASRGRSARANAAARSQAQFLLQYRRAHRLTVTGIAALDATRILEVADHDRIEARLAHQLRRDFQRARVVAGDRNGKARRRAVGLILENAEIERVERAHQSRAGKIFLRHDADAV